MQRREFITLIAGGAVLRPLTANAQQTAKPAKIGYLAVDLAGDPTNREAFLQGLRDLGYIEGRSVLIEYRDAQGKPERFPALAAELVALKVDVLVAGGGTLGALAAKQATTSLPIVSRAATSTDMATAGLSIRYAYTGVPLTRVLPLVARNRTLISRGYYRCHI